MRTCTGIGECVKYKHASVHAESSTLETFVHMQDTPLHFALIS